MKNVIWTTLSMVVMISLAFPIHAAEIWRESTYDDFADGTFGDGGANMYVSANGRVQTINRWDVNGDRYIDILCVNSHPLIEMLDMSIYWGNGKDFSIERHSYVPADCPMRVTPGDLNADDHTDLVVANFSNSTWTSMDSAIYWGGWTDSDFQAKSGEWAVYPFKGKTNLPTQSAQGAAIGDFNKDGHPDIVFAFSAGSGEYRGIAGEFPSRIYWNTGTGFDPEKFTELGTRVATDVDVADFNGDGWCDLVFSNGEGDESFIYFGGENGFSDERRIGLPTVAPHAVKVGDVNNDGSTDILFANESGSVSYAYLNQGGLFNPSDRIEFETFWAKDVVVADFNNDGMNDVFFTNHQQAWQGNGRFANRVIESFVYYGSKEGFSRSNRVGLQTIGAWGANAADLNNDGWVDLLVCNFQEHYSYEVPSFIYWNGPDGFDITRRTPLYEHGAQGNAIADFNDDGHLDILITSMMATSRGDYDPSYLYFGKKDGRYRVDDRIELPGREPYEQAMADLNDDGQVDILLQNQGEVMRYENELWIYWNKDNQFDPWRITGLPAFAGVGVDVADLDRDGYLDIIISNNRNFPNNEGGKPRSFIYWGGANGWVVTERTELGVAQTRGPSIADLNGDGNLDLVFAGPYTSIFFGDGTRNYSDQRCQMIKGTARLSNHQTEVADLNKDGYLDIVYAGSKVLIYYGDSSASYDKKVTLDIEAKTMNIADVNSDSWLDLICPFYKYKGNRSLRSSVLLGGPKGFSVENRLELPTDGGTGALVSDFNFDSYPDILFFCHSQDGSPEVIGQYSDHHTKSRLYWGGPQGFKDNNYLGIPSVGSHYDMGVDLGNIYDRGFLFDYVSSPYRLDGKKPVVINWAAETPYRTSIKFQLRSAESRQDLKVALWTGPGGQGTYYTYRGSSVRGLPKGGWIQYRAIFDTDNGAYSPILSTVEITLD